VLNIVSAEAKFNTQLTLLPEMGGFALGLGDRREMLAGFRMGSGDMLHGIGW
jgi:hypothetical protein